MNKKVKVLITFLVTILIIGVIAFCWSFLIKKSDKNASNKNANNDLVQEGEISNNINLYKTQLEDLPQNYTLDNAIKDGCYYITYMSNTTTINNTGESNTSNNMNANNTNKNNIEESNASEINTNRNNNEKVYNLENLERFLNNYQNKINDKIRIVFTTVEGDLCLREIEFNNNQIIVKNDYSRDKFSEEKDRKIITTTYNANEYKIICDEMFEKTSIYLEKDNNFETREFLGYYPTLIEYNSSFELIYKRRKDAGIDKIIEKGTLTKYDIYTFGGDVYIKINNEEIPLKEAVEQNKITIENIIHNAVLDAKENKIKSNEMQDGGTRTFIYNTGKEQEPYSIIKCNNLDGNRDVYFGMLEMYYNGETVEFKY